MAERVVLRVLMTWLAVVVIQGTESALPPVELAIPRLIEAIKIPTISTDNGPEDPKNFQKFLDYIFTTFPWTHNKEGYVDYEIIDEYNLLYTVRGHNASLPPYLIAAHYDVVPANAAKWKYPPFSGDYKDNYVYGRGTLDDKSRIMAILEVLEDKISLRAQPARSFYMAFVHDGEVNGQNGSKAIAELLGKRKVKLEFIVDKGTPVLKDFLSSMSYPMAIIGVAEKGYAKFKLTSFGTPGHSSIPSRDSSLETLTRAIANLESNRFPIKLDSGLEKVMVAKIFPLHLNCFYIIFNNTGLFYPTISLFADRHKIVNALLRTTTVATIIEGGNKSNVIPGESTAIVSHRIYTTDTVKGVLARDKEVVNDRNVVFEIVDSSEPSKVSSYDKDALGYKLIKEGLESLIERVTVVPGLSVGVTNTKWYRKLTDQVYRFSPFVINPEDVATIHGDNERISSDNYDLLIRFYAHLVMNGEK